MFSSPLFYNGYDHYLICVSSVPFISPLRCTNEPSALISMRGVTVYNDAAYARKCPCFTYHLIFAAQGPAQLAISSRSHTIIATSRGMVVD